MNVLFLHANQPDYLAESLFHGLRQLLGEQCVDFPRYDSMYFPVPEGIRGRQRGYGFSLYGLLDDIESVKEERFYWRSEFILPKYDLVVIADIWTMAGLAYDLSSVLDPKKMVILDGVDFPAFFPYANIKENLIKQPLSFLMARSLDKYKYFKRELYGGLYNYGLDKYAPRSLVDRWKTLPKNRIPISFSIPKEKIWYGEIDCKTKDFPAHIVDSEVSSHVSDTSEHYLFTQEEEYYQDLRASRFGVTTKRAGWDCLRHYELAAQGCVLCFRDLDRKPDSCAPHGLDKTNSIIYHNYSELEQKIADLTPDDYANLRKKTYQWVERNTTIARAKDFLDICCSL
ncbi:hypothetical protein [Roseofilum casamattae]|uniref:Glycosyltransferase family 1 protein n=1 Tax=Roseofilum casamattae BLCC-M143 TaxID=3022442 RepID=A0ABT7C1Y1_9CYAN|nr:hypothetical protein [Roseofilum casamattae]MDJ1185077.1 hypothetical protein [Roseofilum casamattae BLCC-M143]